jgi:hypothetical protein
MSYFRLTLPREPKRDLLDRATSNTGSGSFAARRFPGDRTMNIQCPDGRSFALSSIDLSRFSEKELNEMFADGDDE